MKFFTPLALALAVLCVTSDSVVAASKGSEVSNNVCGPLRPNSVVPLAGTDSLIVIVIITAASKSEGYDCQGQGEIAPASAVPGVDRLTWEDPPDLGGSDPDANDVRSGFHGTFSDWSPPGVPGLGADVSGPHVLTF